MRWTSRYTPDEIERAQLPQPPELRAMKMMLIEATEEAAGLFKKLPPAEMGCLYLEASGRPVCPDPEAAEFGKLTRHFGSVRGAWPRMAE